MPFGLASLLGPTKAIESQHYGRLVGVDEYPEPTVATVKQLYGSAFRCAEPNCNRPLYRIHDESGDLILNSRVAHIHGRRRNGPRWVEMDLEANRAVTNLLLLCIDHSYEVDNPAFEETYPAELLREWKAGQLNEYRRIQRNWPLTDDEAGEVASVSFGGEQVHTALRVELARVVGTIVAVARRARSEAAEEIDAWRGTWDRVNAMMFVYGADGERLTAEPSRLEADAHRSRVLEALARAGQVVAGPVDELRALIAAAITERAELSPWLSQLTMAVSAVDKAATRWPEPPPFADDSTFEDAIAGLERALRDLVQRWKGDTTVPVPPEPQPASEPAESEFEYQLRTHDEMLERARPHARVDHLEPDLDLFAALSDSLAFAASLPPIVSHLSRGLDATTALAAATIKNADETVWAAAIDSCISIEPLAAGVHLARQIAIAALENDKAALAEAARSCAVTRLSEADWTSTTTWAANTVHVRSLLDMAASELGNDVVNRWVAHAVSNPYSLAYVLLGCADVFEQRDSRDFHRILGIGYKYTEVPPWFPIDAVAAAIRAQEQTPHNTPGPAADDPTRHLAATILDLAAQRST